MNEKQYDKPFSVPTTVYCSDCKSMMIIILYPGQMMPVSDEDKRRCLVCNSDQLRTVSN